MADLPAGRWIGLDASAVWVRLVTVEAHFVPTAVPDTMGTRRDWDLPTAYEQVDTLNDILDAHRSSGTSLGTE